MLELPSRVFGRNNTELRSKTPLTDDQIRRVAPSVFAEAAHDSRSERYAYIPTIDILNGLRKEGFEPFQVAQSRSRDSTRREFTKHLIRVRHGSHAKVGDELNEIVIVNAHDGTASLQIFGGVLVLRCLNGMVGSRNTDDVKVPHKGDVTGQVIEGAYRVINSFERTNESIESMKDTAISHDEQLAFGTAALALRYEEGAEPVDAERIIQARRREERGSDLWSLLNRTQENIIRGGQDGKTRNGHNTTTRAITGIDQGVKLNRALWVLAEQMQKLRNH